MKRILVTFLKIAVGVSLLIFVLSRTDLTSIWHLVTASRPGLLVLAFVCYTATVLASSLRWRLLLVPHGMRVGFWKLVVYNFVGLFVNNFLPTSIGGDIMRTIDLARESGQRAEAAASVFMERVMGLAAIVFQALIGFLLIGRIDYKPQLFLIVLAFLGILLVMFVILFFDLPMGRLKSWAGSITFLEFGRRTRKLYGSLKMYRQSRNILAGVFFISLLFQVLNVVFVYLVNLALGLGIQFYYIFLFVPLIGLVGFIPFSINALGLREGAYVFLLARIERTSAEALSLSLLVYAITIVVSLVGGLFFMFRHEGRKWREAGRTADDLETLNPPREM